MFSGMTYISCQVITIHVAIQRIAWSLNIMIAILFIVFSSLKRDAVNAILNT